MKNNKEIKKSIISYFNKRKEGKNIDILPKDKKPLPQIIEPIQETKQEKPRKPKQYISPELDEIISKLNKKIDFIAKRPIEYLNTKIIEKHTNTNEIKTLREKHTNTNEIKTLREKHTNTNEIKTLREKQTNTNEIKTLREKQTNNNTQKIINKPKEIKIPVIETPLELKDNIHNTKNEKTIKNNKLKNIHNQINKILINNHRKDKKDDVRYRITNINKNIKTPTITNTNSVNNKTPTITNTNSVNNKTDNPLSFVFNKTNTPNKTISKILNNYINNNDNKNLNNKKSYSIDNTTINKILDNKMTIPSTIPAYQEGGLVDKGGKVVVVGEKEKEWIIPDSKVKKVAPTQNLPQQVFIEKTTARTPSSVATESMNQNTALKTQELSNNNNSPSAPIINNANNITVGGGGGGSNNSNASIGGTTKAVESMRQQTQYPIWRQGFG